MRTRSSTIYAFHEHYMMKLWDEWITWTHRHSFLINRFCNMMSWSHLVQVVTTSWSVVFNHDYVVFTPYQRQTRNWCFVLTSVKILLHRDLSHSSHAFSASNLVYAVLTYNGPLDVCTLVRGKLRTIFHICYSCSHRFTKSGQCDASILVQLLRRVCVAYA